MFGDQPCRRSRRGAATAALFPAARHSGAFRSAARRHPSIWKRPSNERLCACTHIVPDAASAASLVVAALAAVAVAVVPLAWVVLQKKPAPPGKPAVVSVSAAPVLVQDAAISITAIGCSRRPGPATSSSPRSAASSAAWTSSREPTSRRVGLLAQIDPTPYQAALTQAQGTLQRDQALLAGARVDLARYATLVKQDLDRQPDLCRRGRPGEAGRGTVLLDQGVVATAQVNLNQVPAQAQLCSVAAAVGPLLGNHRYPRFPDG